jgi:hypothetical protein
MIAAMTRESAPRRSGLGLDRVADAGTPPCAAQQPFMIRLSEPSRRPELLSAGLDFVRAAIQIPGVRQVSLIGSICTNRSKPKAGPVAPASRCIAAWCLT